MADFFIRKTPIDLTVWILFHFMRDILLKKSAYKVLYLDFIYYFLGNKMPERPIFFLKPTTAYITRNNYFHIDGLMQGTYITW